MVVPTKVDRDAKGVPCEKCDGYADRVPANVQEQYDYGCDYDKHDKERTSECCVRVFVCRLCNHRMPRTAEGPEMDG